MALPTRPHQHRCAPQPKRPAPSLSLPSPSLVHSTPLLLHAACVLLCASLSVFPLAELACIFSSLVPLLQRAECVCVHWQRRVLSLRCHPSTPTFFFPTLSLSATPRACTALWCCCSSQPARAFASLYCARPPSPLLLVCFSVSCCFRALVPDFSTSSSPSHIHTHTRIRR